MKLALRLMPLVMLAVAAISPARAAEPDWQGTLREFKLRSKIFPGTERSYWVYVPKQYKRAKPAALLVVQDGKGNAKNWRLPETMDQLIASGEMPVTIGVFVNHGVVAATSDNALARWNRSFEYDGLGDRYVRMLLEEILPKVEKQYRIKKDANSRAIAGASSGAIAAFTAAWERPDKFSRVLSTIGTYVALRGGHNYPVWVRQMEPKPLRIFLQDGSNDLNIFAGDWWMANQTMLSALKFSGYEVNHIWGDGKHNAEHAREIMPEALRWLWKGYPAPITVGQGSRQPVMKILDPEQDWQQVSRGHKFTEGPAVAPNGDVYFTDIPNKRIHKVNNKGKVSVFVRHSGGANGLMFGPDGRLYAAQNGKRQIVAYDAQGNENVVARDLNSNDLTIASDGSMYVTDPESKQLWYVAKDGRKRVVDTGIRYPNGVALTPDQSHVWVADARGRFLYIFQRKANGDLQYKQPYCHLHIDQGETPESGADGLTVDRDGKVYVASRLGVQICDQMGRVRGIIRKPQRAWLSNVVFGGPNLDTLYATSGDKVFKRKLRTQGLRAETVLKPKKPGL